mmetsp:Transcript_15708/g.2605  ORF Transcript_15708/g.2605 Transcript_15708/m.2605 type:complete len:170 (+) Transcript_15708:165-674(+)
MLTNYSSFVLWGLSSLLDEFFYDEEYKQEIESVVKTTGTQYDVISVANYLFDIDSACTSIVFKLPNGKIGHNRILDFDFKEYIEPLVANFEFYRNGQLVYYSTNFVGFFGQLTVLKPNGFGITVDQLANDRALWPDYFLMMLGHTGSTHAIRKAAETLDSFDEAVDYLS